MSFFSSIGKALGGVLHTVTQVADFIKKPLDMITKPLQSLIDPLLDKLPFGIGSFIKPFADKFLSSAIGFLAGGPLGGLMATLTSVDGVVDKVDDVLHTVDGVVNGGISNLPQAALSNVQEGTAWSQAQSLFA
ncbi:MAG: hypothetical protein JST54_25555 [Deltaproteobacteria bacterium]|nr:hypothetical protein [Deltaproteobacteria bacterium]